jgi:flagellin
MGMTSLLGALAQGVTPGSVYSKLNTVTQALNTFGNQQDYVNNQIGYNSNKIDALNAGLGALVDADLTKESAQLQSLQVKQQLATQALTIANQSPASLLKLFGG